MEMEVMFLPGLENLGTEFVLLLNTVCIFCAGMEMEVTFLPGLENLGERLLAKKAEREARKGETVWDAYLRRKK